MKQFFALTAALLILPFPSLAAQQRPNIVFILADDFGLDGVGIYGSDRFQGRTPNVDRLAQSGIRFENAYCTPLCGPTRCLLNTGRYGFRTGGTSNQNTGQPKASEEPALARTLQSAGYATGMAGKWRQVGGSPGDWGFGEFITDPTAGGRQVNGHKGTMLEGGAHVPLIANWKGVTPGGKVLMDLVDFSDLFPTFVELAGTTLPAGVKFDGRSFAPQLRGLIGHPRDWIYVQLGAKWYARNAGWKLNQGGELFDLSDAPFVEKTVAVAGQTRSR